MKEIGEITRESSIRVYRNGKVLLEKQYTIINDNGGFLDIILPPEHFKGRFCDYYIDPSNIFVIIDNVTKFYGSFTTFTYYKYGVYASTSYNGESKIYELELEDFCPNCRNPLFVETPDKCTKCLHNRHA